MCFCDTKAYRLLPDRSMVVDHQLWSRNTDTVNICFHSNLRCCLDLQHPGEQNACGENIGLSKMPVFQCFQRLNNMEHLSFLDLGNSASFTNWEGFFFFF